ncbi:hypothetical protein GOODEAATRI_003381, partial [Goodea atripinnis]
KKVQIRKPAPALTDVAPSRRTSRPVLISSSTLKKSTTQHRPLRERLVHLLALKPYKKPEMILRLQKDGLSQLDKESLDSHLQQLLNCISPCGSMNSHRKQAQTSSAPVPESPPKELGSSSPSQVSPVFPHRVKRPAADFIDPLVNKKPRISHLASKAVPVQVNGKLSSSCGRGDSGRSLSGAAVSTSEGIITSGSQPLPVLDILRPFEALSDVSNDSSNNGRDCDSQETKLSERLSQPSSLSSVSTVAYTPSEQRQRYKNDFNAEYSEYRGLHARIEGITRQFTVLDNELKQLQQGTDKYKDLMTLGNGRGKVKGMRQIPMLGIEP